jgi:transcriptional regulator with XRE-family HTH domain
MSIMPTCDLSKPRPNSIKYYRVRKGLTMKQLAVLIGLPETGQIEVSKWESGERRPNRFALPVVAKALGVKPDELMAPWPGEPSSEQPSSAA